MGDLIDQLFKFLEQLILPNWPDLIGLLPWVLVVLVVASLAGFGYYWVKSGSRNRSRVPKPVKGSPPPGVHLPGPSRWPFVAPIGAALLLFAFALPPKDASGDATAPFSIPLLALGLLVTFIAIAGWLWDAMHEWRATAHPEAAHGAVLPDGASAAVALAPGALVPRQRPGAFGAAAQAAVDEFQPVEPPPGVHLPGPSPWPFFAPIGATVLLYGFIFSSVLIVAGILLTLIAVAGWYLDANHELNTTEEFGHAVPETRDPRKVWPRRLVPLYGAVIVISLAIMLAPTGIGFLNSLTPPEATAKPIVVPANPVIAAKGVKFDTATLIVPAGRPFELTFNNNDEGVPHDVAIQTADKATDLFDGDIVTGPASVTYNVPALDPGSYYFLCTVHPNMNGTVTAAPESGGGAPPAGNNGGPTAAPQASSEAP
jgi:plastocyanin